jgi:proteasome accessory factor B
MAIRKSERLMNLLIMLLVARRHLDKAHIRGLLYPDSSDEAFEKMFERDKEELRQLGIPIDVASQDVFFDDEQGYRIRREAFELPDISLEADEAAVLGLAARVWQHAGMAGATSDALLKLKAAGVDVDRTALDLVEPHLTAEEPAFEALWAAAQSRTPVEFGYQRTADAEPTTRRVQPWRLLWHTSRWYLLGHDEDRGAARMFRLSRITGAVRTTGEPGGYDLPPEAELAEATRVLAPAPAASERITAHVLVRSGMAHGLRRQGDLVDADVAGPDTETRWDRLEITHLTLPALADEVLSTGPDAFVESPPELRDEVVARLREAVA